MYYNDTERMIYVKKEIKNKWWLILVGIVVIIAIIFLLLHYCSNGKKYKIILHGDETIEVDSNFKLSDLEVKGGSISFLVDSDGHIVLPAKN